MSAEDREAALNAALNRELADFGYAIAHDFRSPLRAIAGFSEALEEDYGDRLDDDGREYLARIRAAAARMDQLIDDLATLARASREELHVQTVDVTAVAESIAADLSQSDPSRAVAFSIGRDLKVEADAALVRMAFEQLLANAWKFTRNRPGATVEIGCAERDGRRAFFVRDDGAGFDDTYAARLFIPFQRLHTQAEFEGNGIGLAIVRRIAHRHGGRVWADGEVDKGATIYIAFD